MEDYIKGLRKKVGHDKVILNYAGCVYFNEDGKLVLQKRSDCNEWGFFGGLVELGESLAEAAVREVKEESGYDVAVTSLFGIYSKYFATYANPYNKNHIIYFFSCILFYITSRRWKG